MTAERREAASPNRAGGAENPPTVSQQTTDFTPDPAPCHKNPHANVLVAERRKRLGSIEEEVMRRIMLAIVIGTLAVGGMTLAHHGGHGKGALQFKVLSQRDITEKMDGKKAKATTVEVTLGPGEVEPAHRHPGPAFGYVLEGEYEWAIDDNPPRSSRPGTPSTSRPAACTASAGTRARRARRASWPWCCTPQTSATSSSQRSTTRSNSAGRVVLHIEDKVKPVYKTPNPDKLACWSVAEIELGISLRIKIGDAHEDRGDRRHRTHREEVDPPAASTRSRSGGGVSLFGRQHAHGRRAGRGARGRSGRRRCVELPFVRGQGGAGVLRDVGRNLLAAEAAAGVGHHVALSVVGADRMPDSGYMRAKVAQERLIQGGKVPYTIVRATQFFEFLGAIAGSGADTVRLPDAPMQPLAADDVAAALADVAVGPPANATLELAGPEAQSMAAFVRRALAASGDTRTVVADPQARYFGAALDARGLTPDGANPRIGPTRFEEWLSRR